MLQVDLLSAESLRQSVEKRAHDLMSLGAAAVEELGRPAEQGASDALVLLEDVSERTSKLMDVSRRLVPLITSFQNNTSKRSFWGWFTGEQLKHDVFIDDVRSQIEELAQSGQKGHEGMATQVRLLTQQYELMSNEILLLQIDIKAAQVVASSAHEARRFKEGLKGDDFSRFIRRVSNLEAVLSATQLTQAQYLVAIQHAKSVADRYHEIRTLLLPIWKQRVGFDLFARRVNAQLDEG